MMRRFAPGVPLLLAWVAADARGEPATPRETTASDRPRGPRVAKAQAAKPLFLLTSEEARSAAFERLDTGRGALTERLERVTRGLVGAPYVLSPLGEEEPPDPDPRFRLDAFDCTTFVETAMALADAGTWSEAKTALETIRYREDGRSFQDRRHLIEAQWIPELVALGYLEELTEAIGGEDTVVVELALTERRWKSRRIARKLAIDAVPYGTYRIPAIPPAALMKRLDEVPAGTILNVVRADVPWSGVLITHQGLVLSPPGYPQAIVRHASPVSKRVIDETLEHMIRRYLRPRPWPIAGIRLLRIVDRRARR